METTNVSEAMTSWSATVRAEASHWRRPGRIAALVVAALVTAAIGLGSGHLSLAECSIGEVEVPCPGQIAGPDGQPVSDQFFFAHRPLAGDGSITVRVRSMEGIITYPPPDHDEIVPGLVPWAKAGIMIKDGVEQGAGYAALMVTADHGVRFQHDFVGDVAGEPGGVAAGSPRWLRLTRRGTMITGSESSDGRRWTEVGTVDLTDLPSTAEVGLFVTSPGDLTLRPVGLGGAIEEVRFTQATATFDQVALEGAAPSPWIAEPIGEMGVTDWERHHRPPGLVEEGGALTVTGSGDVGPLVEGGPTTGGLGGLVPAMAIMAAVGAASAAVGGSPSDRRALAARAALLSLAALITGAAAVGVSLALVRSPLAADGVQVAGMTAGGTIRLVLGAGVLAAALAVLGLGLGLLTGRVRLAALLGIGLGVAPFVVGSVPLLPDHLARWMLRLSPAAGFAVLQTRVAYHQVVAHYAPSSGHLPLPWWAGLAVAAGWAAAALAAAGRRLPPS